MWSALSHGYDCPAADRSSGFARAVLTPADERAYRAKPNLGFWASVSRLLAGGTLTSDASIRPRRPAIRDGPVGPTAPAWMTADVRGTGAVRHTERLADAAVVASDGAITTGAKPRGPPINPRRLGRV